MSKATITKLFIGAGLAMIAGTILAFIGLGVAVANNVFVMNGSDVVGLHGGAVAWSSLGLALVGVLAFIGGLAAGLVAWIGALLNTWQLDNKGWFVGLLLLGIFNLGFFAMVAYLLAGPDGSIGAADRPAVPAPRPTPA
jgi:hypothetical protein